MLPTPTSRDFKNAGNPAKTAGRMADRGQPLTEIAVNILALLPTPRASDGERGGPNRPGSSGDLVPPAQVRPGRLLPSPSARDWRDGGETGANVEEKAYLGRVVWGRSNWGQYDSAIARWESALGRPAPKPTQTSKVGSQHLSPAFVEWMMGLPAGWVTDAPGITRNEALKALGNGVVPQQCAAALRIMLAQAVAA